MTPTPITPPAEDFGVRALSLYDLELTLVKFLQRLFYSARLDNPTLNLGQATQAAVPIEPNPLIPFDYKERAQTLELKVPPRIVRGRVPRTVTGEIAVDKLPDCPSIIVQALSAKVQNDETIVTLRICFSAYDENPDGGGYQDVLNMIEAASIALTSFGQEGLDQSYVIVMPLEWSLIEADTFPHYIGEMTTQWELPSGRPLPDPETFGIVPAEHIDLKASYDYGERQKPPPWEEPPPYQPPPLPAAPELIYSHAVELQDDVGNSYGIMGSDAGEADPFAMSASYQALQLPQGGKLSSVALFVRPKSGSPTCDLIVQLFAAEGAAGAVKPTGPVLATSDPISCIGIPQAGEMTEFFFNGANEYALQQGQTYAFVFTFSGAYPTQGQYIFLGMHWEQTLPNNVGFYQRGWQNDDYGTLTLYLYARPYG